MYEAMPNREGNGGDFRLTEYGIEWVVVLREKGKTPKPRTAVAYCDDQSEAVMIADALNNIPAG